MDEPSRRKYLAGLVAIAGLGGCLDALSGGGTNGSGDTDGDGEDSDGTPGPESAGPKQTVRAFYTALDEGRFDAASRLMHSNTTEPPVTESRYGRLAEGTVRVESAEVIERGEDRAVVRTAVRASVPGESGTFGDEVAIELRRENGRWKLYSSNQSGSGDSTSDTGREPVQGPEAVVREFYRAMDDGNRQAAKSLVHSDAPRELVTAQTLDQLERATVTVDDTSIRERTSTGIVVTVTLTASAPESGRSETNTIALELRMENDRWRIYGRPDSG